MLPKAHLTSHSRMYGSVWWVTIMVIWAIKLLFNSSSVYSCHLFLISSASVRSIPFLCFIEPIFAWNVPLGSLIFLKRSLVFPVLLFSSISLHWLLRKASLSLLAILWNSAFKWVYLSFSPFLSMQMVQTADDFSLRPGIKSGNLELQFLKSTEWTFSQLGVCWDFPTPFKSVC